MASKRRQPRRKGRRHRPRRRINAKIPMRGGGKKRVGYVLPVSAGMSITAQKQSRGERPGSRPRWGWWLPVEGPPVRLRS